MNIKTGLITEGRINMNSKLFLVAFFSLVLMLSGLFSAPVPVQAQTSCSTSSTFGTITKSVTAPTSATYTAWIRLWVPSGASKSVKLSANTICKDVSVPGNSGTWVWTNKDSGGGTLQTALTANQSYNVVISGQAAGVRVDRVLLLSDSCTPTGTGDNCTTTDTTAPTVEISQPSNGSTVSGNVSTQFDISDTGDTSKVELLVNGQAAGTSTTAPFTITWDSRLVSDGVHTMQARLTDKDGNTAMSDSLTLNVVNNVSGSVTSRLPIDAYNDGGEGAGYHDTTAGNNGDGTCRNDDVDLKAAVVGCTLGWFTTGEWLEYDVTVTEAGNYTFQVNAASGDSDGGKFRLELDGNNVSGTVDVANTGSYDSYSIVSKTVALTAGDHTLRFFNVEQHFDVAWLQFVGPGSVSIGEISTPPPDTDVTSKLNMDTYNDGGEGVGYHDTTDGNLSNGACRGDDVDLKASDNGCLVGHFATGEWLEYDVNISKAGSYGFQLSAARGESGNGGFHLEVDGDDATGRVDIPSTGSWDTFATINSTVDLPAGEHTLRFHNDQQYFDAAWMQFTGPGTVTLVSTPTPPPPPTNDTTPPSQPTGLTASSVTQNTVGLTWNASVDSGVGVVGYGIYRDGQLLQAVPSIGFTDSNLNPNSSYRYEVSALDAVGNESTKAVLNVKTEAVPEPPSDEKSADLDDDGNYTVADLAIFKTRYHDDDQVADFDANGELDVRDWALFLAAWKEGR